MKTLNTKTIMIVLACLLICINGTALTWIQKNSFNPGNRYGAFGFSVGQFGYVGSGLVQTGTSTSLVNDFWQYDPMQDSWTQKATLPGNGRIGAATFSALGAGFVTTGFDQVSYLKEHWKYDPLTNSWQAMADFPGDARYSCAGFDVSDYGFVGMGKSVGYYADFYRYNPATDTWTSIAPMPGIPRQSARGFSIADYGYVAGGAEEGSMFNSKELWRYDPISDIWIQKSDYPGNGSHGMSAFVIGSEGYVGAGTMLIAGQNPVFNDFHSYNPATDSWTAIQSFSGGVRQGAVSMNIGNVGFVGLGSTLIFPLIDYKADWWTFADPTGLNDLNGDENHVIAYFDINQDLVINLLNGAKGTSRLLLIDATGKTIHAQEIKNAEQNVVIKNLSIANGVYFYSIAQSTSKVLSGKVMLIK